MECDNFHKYVGLVSDDRIAEKSISNNPPRSKELRPIGAYAQTEGMLLKIYAVQRLGEDIRDHLSGWAVTNSTLPAAAMTRTNDTVCQRACCAG